MFILKSNLGKRILLLVSISMLLMLIAFVISGWLAINQTSNRALQERQGLAQATSKYLDHVLEQNLRLLENFRFAPGVDLGDGNLEPEKSALHNIYLNSIFDEGVFITDNSGVVLWIEPYQPNFIGLNLSQIPPVSKTLSSGRTALSGSLDKSAGRAKAVVVTTPIHNAEGRLVGTVGGEIDPTARALQDVTHLATLDETNYIDIIDSEGKVIASSDPARTTNAASFVAGQGEVTVLAPVTYAPWSVAIRQSEANASAPLRGMELRLIVFGLSSVILLLLFAWGMARSIIKPLNQLKAAAQNISTGDLSQPILQSSDDEIGQLSRSFDNMRIALKKSLDEINLWNRDLESKVHKRTQQLEDSYHEIERKESARSELLRKLFSAQEEERKRIARELHDETSQSLNGLVMRMEAALAIPDTSPEKIKALLAETKKLAVRTVDNVHKIIFDLRPAVLDDLGLLSALRWYTQNRLSEQGVKVRIEVTGEERKLSATVENAVFRVVQEAVNNIVRHAEAQNVLLSVEFNENNLNIEIEDDGKGFVEKLYNPQGGSAQGLGLLGMKERVSILGGELKIDSRPGSGTHIYISVPLV